MNRISKMLPQKVIVILFLLLVAKMIATGLYLFLPSQGVSLQKRFDFTPEYIRLNLAELFRISKKVSVQHSSIEQTVTFGISDLVLKALYGNDQKGFVIIAKKSDPKHTTIISIGEKFSGYRLVAIRIDYVVFEKNAKEYRLDLEKTKQNSNITYHHVTSVPTETAVHTVEKRDIGYFAAHPREIWKNISIKEVRRHGKIEGFKVMWIRQNSKFAMLGLKKGDLIIKVNNKRLKSYRDAINVYNNISKIREVAIVVVRNGEEKELVYEIN